MASTQRKDRREKELLDLGRQAKSILEERDQLREEAAKWKKEAEQFCFELREVSECCERLQAELLEVRKQEAGREEHYHDGMNSRDARIHQLSSDLQRAAMDLLAVNKKLEAMDGHDIKTMRRRLAQKSEEIKELKTTISRLESQRRKHLM